MIDSTLVNTFGHATGVLVFGVFLYLLVRLGGSRRPMLAALLALLWNLASLFVLAAHSTTNVATETAVAVGFSVLSLLPAVLFDLCLAGRFRVLTRWGYALSTLAIALHGIELIAAQQRYHRWGLVLITFGFGALTVAAAIAGRRESIPRTVAVMSLFLFAMSFVHLDSSHAEQAWSRELAFHHAGIPLALVVLLQDYRFLLLDAFFRVLADLLLAVAFALGALWTADRLAPADGFERGLILIAAALALVLFALVRSRLQAFLTRMLFGRADTERLLASLEVAARDESSYIANASAKLAEFMSADLIKLDERLLDRWKLASPTLTSELARVCPDAEVIVPVRLGPDEIRLIGLGRRRGGRHYLSEDLEALARASTRIAEHVERFRVSELRRLVSQAELRALQSQINPHFLFNALNTLYGVIPRSAEGARRTVLNLADIFRYFLTTDRSFLPLEEELAIVRAYLDIERLRLGEKLTIEIDVDDEALTELIPVLCIQPLVENAVRHGIAPQAGGGTVRVEAHVRDGALAVAVLDTGAGFHTAEQSGVGLENVRRRLELCYGPGAELEIACGPAGTSVRFVVPMAKSAEVV
jgi:hypothetical protein